MNIPNATVIADLHRIARLQQRNVEADRHANYYWSGQLSTRARTFEAIAEQVRQPIGGVTNFDVRRWNP